LKLPKVFTYMHHTFDIRKGKIKENEMEDVKSSSELWGKVYWMKDEIIVSPKLKGYQKRETLAHELWHVAMDKCGLPIDGESLETFVDTVAKCMLEMFDANPWFGSYFQGDS
jgi:Zn-dependent peptidase ImmA (M78 family)